VLAGLSGINMVSGPGMLDFESTQSFEKLVIDNEIAGMVMRMVNGITDYGEPFAKDILNDYDANYSLLSHSTTLSLFRKELYISKPINGLQVTNRETREQWKSSGSTSARKRAKGIAEALSIREPRVEINDSLKSELGKIASENLA
ncbi:unnamed protein product, partial [marine sediment metagenome]